MNEDEGEGARHRHRHRHRQRQGTNESEDLKRAYDERRCAGDTWTRHVSWIGEMHAEQVTSIQDAVVAFTGPACSLWPYKLVFGLLARLVARHPPPRLNVQTYTTVTAITTMTDNKGDTWNVTSTSRGVMRARKLVFATIAYTAGLLPQFGGSIVPICGMASHITPAHVPIPVPAGNGGSKRQGKVVVGVEPGAVHPHLNNTYNISFGPERGVDYLNPRPDGGIVVGSGKWKDNKDRSAWYDNFDDSERFSPGVEAAYWHNYRQRTFSGWERSRAAADSVWVGIIGITPDGWPHVGRVPGGGDLIAGGANSDRHKQHKQQWMLAGFNGGGMALILTAAKAGGYNGQR
ncbi:hypothetical protein SLS62_011309 [Diatrype stigma]|uniref:FAD dependent oxidoreductase domain-containing protein n=1 Tax=Diatrype stigma TaxID=117547 RepID=A0AAN9YFD8_9PEZI